MPQTSPVSQAGYWDVFAPYGWLHLASVAVCFAAIAALAIIARRLDKPAELALRRGLAAFAIAVWVGYNIAWNWNGIDFRHGLPLHICDIGQIVAALALLSLDRWLRATLYFWSMALTTQAFIQPTLTFGPSSVLFWCFWIAHSIILGYAVYDLAVLRFRPDWSDLKRAAIVTLGYLAITLPINIALGSNYGFTGDLPAKDIPPFVAALGPWPWRIAVIAALVGLAFLLALAPWRLWARPAARLKA